MGDTIRIDLHCHSSISDGILSPEQVAAALAAASVHYAALTDHNSTEGSVAFRQAAARLGIGSFTGIELSAWLNQKEIHLLGYGFILDNEELQKTLPALRPQQTAVGPNYAAQRRLSSAEAIALIHQAGGLVVLAHPLITEPDDQKLKRLVEDLHREGLDGLEALRTDLRAGEQEKLTALAAACGLVQSAGTDNHFVKNSPDSGAGIDVPLAVWKSFRDAVLTVSARQDGAAVPEHQAPRKRSATRIRWQSFARHIVLPAMLALALFAGVLLFAVLPTFEQALLDRKREMIRELTNAAWSILADAAGEEARGTQSGTEARMQAKKRIEAMRYGREGKDYFWIQDTIPKMIMHPYRKDLNGTDLSGFTDPSGAPIFVLFSRLVKEKREGYVHYVWQWKDDPTRLEPKESYIRLFEPWGWIIGTGIYVHDVREELRRLEQRLLWFSAAIFAVIALLLIYMLRSSLQLERKRSLAEDLLQETTNRYKTLVNASTEGMLFLQNGRCKYANPLALEILGYLPHELELLDRADILPAVAKNRAILAAIKTMHAGITDQPVMGQVRGRDGRLIDCDIVLQYSPAAAPDGYLILLRRIRNGGSAEPQGNLLKLPGLIAGDIREAIGQAATVDGITAQCLRMPPMVQSLLVNGAFAPEIARMLSLVTDAATMRLIELAFEKLGAARVPFAFIALGSQGRMEQTLFTDQDNAIIYAQPDAADQQAVTAYFQQLADFVCAGLNQSGYRNCNGKVMANNPRWCQPVAVWKEYFDGWVSRADLQELMEFSIFFDFRVVYGDETLAQEIRSRVMNRVHHSARFLPQAALNALQFKSPLRLFGKVFTTAGKGESGSHIDLKAVTMAVVSFVRLYSLQQGIVETNTGARINELVRKGTILPSVQDEVMTVYALLMRLRLRHQAARMQYGQDPDNRVDPATLGHVEEAILRECFNEIDVLQARIRREFLGEA